MWKLVAKFENAPQREYTTQFEVREYGELTQNKMLIFWQ